MPEATAAAGNKKTPSPTIVLTSKKTACQNKLRLFVTTDNIFELSQDR